MKVQDWIDAGYKRYNENYLKNAEFLLQKCISDSTGVKYFIDVWVYDYTKAAFFREGMPEMSFEPGVQFQGREPVMNVTLLVSATSCTVQDIENEFENLWKSLGCPYYEKYEDS